MDYLQKNINHNANTGCSGIQVVEMSQIQNLVDKLPNPEPFYAKYNDLKQKK